MGKTGKWIKNLLTGKKDHKDKDHHYHHHHHKEIISDVSSNGHSTPISIAQPTTPKEKRRWSFRRSSTNGTTPPVVEHQGAESNDSKKNALVLAAATAAAADAAVAAAKAAAAVIQLTAASSRRSSVVEDAAAVKIQSVFRGCLARKALNALKGLVKLQALVRGHLVRKQATATLRCMQALVTVQARARAQRLRMVEEALKTAPPKHYNHRKSTQENTFRTSSNQDFEENIKIVEMDRGDHYNKPVSKSRNSCSNLTQQPGPIHRTPIKNEHPHQQISPSPSSVISPRTCSNHFEEYSSFGTAQSSPQCYSAVAKNEINHQQHHGPLQFSYPRVEYVESLYSEYPPFYPSYMANTESSRAKVRSHSAPKQRPIETIERPASSRRRPSLEGRNVPRAVRMQRSSSHVGSTAQNYQYPWSVKLDRSAVSLKDSECGSTSTVATNMNYCRSLVGLDVQGGRY